jgi:hypothetical protein
MITHQLITLLLLLHLLCTWRTVLCSHQRQQQEQAAASVTTATTAKDVVSEVAARGSNGTSDISLLVERMHAAACLDNYMTWLRGAHDTDVTLRLMSSGLESWERYYASDNSNLALISHASRLLTSLIEACSSDCSCSSDNAHCARSRHSGLYDLLTSM